MRRPVCILSAVLIRNVLLSLALLAIAAAVAPRALAQQAPEPQDGDLVWTFAQEDPFYDQRVRLALILLMDLDEPGLLPASAEDRDFIAMPGSSGEAELLLAASGIDFAVLDVVGPCGVWVAPPPVEGSPVGVEQREQAGLALGSALSALLESRGAPVGDCVLTTDPSAAQVLIWGYGETAPANPERPAGTLFGPPDLPGRIPGGTGGGTGDGPTSPSTGNAGLVERPGGSDAETADVVLLTAFAIALALAARSVTGRQEP